MTDHPVRLLRKALLATEGWKAFVMFIHEMSEAQCRGELGRAHFGRLACARNNQPYILPMNFAIDGEYLYLYGFTTLGQKIEWMRANPRVCFEIDNVATHNQWVSVIVTGSYEELRDTPEFEGARQRAYDHLQKRVMWWEPAYVSQEHRDHPHSLTPIFFRIRIKKITGHRANADENEAGTTTPADNGNVHEQSWPQRVKATLVKFFG
jgi:nitroimidazol reductase NimA-like FMN-containing flavoprotein (pyridoxamine 5'-phosphate oxidase superfamily)